MAEMNVDLAIQKYVELRDRRTALKADYEAKDEQLKELMGKIENWLLMELDKAGGQNIGTTHGTAYKTYKEYVTIDNYEAFVEYVTANEAYGMFEKRVSKSAVKDYMDANAEGEYQNPPPPGVKLVREVAIGVRRK